MFEWYYLSGILILCGINLMVVLGLSLLTGFTGLFSFGHAGFMAIGAYTAGALSTMLGVPFIPAILCGGLAAMVVSFFIGAITLNLKGDYFCIATLGFGEAMRLIFNNVQFLGGARGMTGIPMKANITVVYIFVVIAIIFMWFLIKSRHGRNMIAIREEELAAQTIGINVFKYKLTSLAISALYAGIGGALWAFYMGYINPAIFMLTKSTEMTIMVIIGGLGSLTGSVLGATFLTFIPELFREFGEWRMVFYGAAVILVMAVRPQGLLGGIEFSPKGIVRWARKTYYKMTTKITKSAEGIAEEAGPAESAEPTEPTEPTEPVEGGES